jgi:FkbM family methyltransferase
LINIFNLKRNNRIRLHKDYNIIEEYHEGYSILKKDDSSDSRRLYLNNSLYTPWHIIYFNDIFNQFSGVGDIIDMRVPAFLKSKKMGKEFFINQAPEDNYVEEGYLEINKPKKDSIVFDVGACFGIMSYVYSKLCKKVVAFEPNPYTYSCLCTNIVKHNLTNVVPVNAGLYEATGNYNISLSLGGGDTILKHKLPGVKETSAKMYSLKDAENAVGLKPTHIKMDIERAEVEFVEGNLDYIKENDFKFAIACYHENEKGRTAEQIEELFKSIGYKTKLTFPKHLTLHAWK